MIKENFEEKRVCEGNVVHVTQTFDIPRYTGRMYGNCREYCDMTYDLIQDECKIWCGARNFSKLSNVEFEPKGDTLQEDLQAFQKMLDKEFGKGKYEAFVLGAYIHGGTSFSINKCGNHVCRFDSSQLGFIGLINEPKETTEHNYISSEADMVAEELTACWEGEFVNCMVIDEETEEVVDEICSYQYNALEKFKVDAKEKYGVDFDEVKIVY